MGDEFRRVSGLHRADDARNIRPRLRYGHIKKNGHIKKKSLAKCGALFCHLVENGNDVPM
jgi:hypothetical protein